MKLVYVLIYKYISIRGRSILDFADMIIMYLKEANKKIIVQILIKYIYILNALMFLVFPSCYWSGQPRKKTTRAHVELNARYILLCKQNTSNIQLPMMHNV